MPVGQSATMVSARCAPRQCRAVNLKAYLREVAFAALETAATRDPRVRELGLRVLARAAAELGSFAPAGERQ
jgi:hypothetical protein